LDRVKQTCQVDILQQLGVKYIYLEANHFIDFEERCLQSNNLKLELEVKEREEVVRVYKLLY